MCFYYYTLGIRRKYEPSIKFYLYNDSDWVCPSEYPDLRAADEVAIDLETKDPDLKKLGAGWAYGKGHIVGFAVAALGKQYYFPIAHDAGGNMDLDYYTVTWMQDY